MKITRTTLALMMAFALPLSHAADRDPKIASNSSGIADSTFINSIATAAIGMGAKEPLNISATENGGKRVVVIAGSNGTRCQVPTSNGNPPQMQGIQCK